MTTRPDPHHGVSFGPEHPCWHEWDCAESSTPHRCVYGRGHLANHHCPCGAETSKEHTA